MIVIGLLGKEAHKNLLECVDKVYGVNGPSLEFYAYKKVSLAEWVALTKDVWTYQNTVEFLDNNILPENWEKTFFELERWLIRREKIEASRVAFQDKLKLMKTLQQNADNISSAKKAKKTVDFTKREKQLEEELVALKEDIALSRSNYQISKQNQLVAEDAARILRIRLDEAHTLNKKYAAEIENLKKPQEESEPTIVEEVSDPIEQIELPKNIVFITGHPRFRNDVKNTLGWDVIDINKSEFHKLSKADLIAYNANSNAHRIYYSLKEEHFEKLVYVRPGTNLKLLVQNVKRGWYELLQARKETESEQ